MPRGFNEQEKERILNTLMVEGKNLFSQFGLKKTGVNELAKAAGIAPGSFYAFFNSKEELYFSIIEKEEEALKQDYIDFEIPKGQDPKETIKVLFLKTFQKVEENPLFSQLYMEDHYQALLRKLPEERLAKHFQKDTDVLGIVSAKWRAAGILKEIDEEVLTGLFRSLFMVSLHKKEIGEEVYPRTLELLVEFLVNGIIR